MHGDLSEPHFRDTEPILTNGSDSPLRLLGTIVAALLAITMAIFPVGMPQAAASTGHSHAALAAGHSHAGGSAPHHDEAAGLQAVCHSSAVQSDCDRNPADPHDHGDANCCGGLGCHSFQVSSAPIISSPITSRILIAVAGDEQVSGIAPGRLDRPPRTM